MSATMSKNMQRTLKKEKPVVNKIPAYSGPHIAGFGVDKQHMPVVTNTTHSANTNNGYARKACGGFYFH